MGFFDRFKKQNKKDEVIQTSTLPEKEYEIQYSYTDDRRLVVELIERRVKLAKFYDTTKLIIDNEDINLGGENVQKCMVSWYRQADTICLDKKGRRKEIPRKEIFKKVLAQIDFDLILSDEEYCLTIMRELLDQNRVEDCLDMGLEDKPDRPCGNYVGGVRSGQEGYEKYFNLDIGIDAHNLPDMIAKRNEIKEINQILQVEQEEQDEDNLDR